MPTSKNQGVKIKFVVAGGSNIDGLSGKSIRADLNKIAQQIKPEIKVGINQTYFKAQVEKIKKKISEISFTGNEVDFNATDNHKKKIEAQIKLYKELRKEQLSLSKDDGEADQRSSAGVARHKEIAEQIERINQEVANSKVASDKEAYDAQVELIEQQLKNEKKAAKDKAKASKKAAGDKAVKGTVKPIQTESTAAKNESRMKSLLGQFNEQINSTERGSAAYARLTQAHQKYLDAVSKETDELDEAGKKKREFFELPPEELAKHQHEFNTELNKTTAELHQITSDTDDVFHKIKDTFGSKMLQQIGYALAGAIANAVRQIYQNVVELDKAVVNLQVATGYSRETTQGLIEDYAKLAQEIGATTIEVAEAADTWLRQGYSIEEANKLIKDSMMLAKLGQMEAAEASKALTSAIKGYKIEVADATKIVDKFTAVDMVAAVSAGDIATAMAETAAGAEVAGVSFDNLTGYIASVSEVTQDGAESVGTFFRSLFARMGNIKIGKFVDDETSESLNDVENVLSSLDIQLRKADGTFREFDDVLDEVAEGWEHYNNVQQHAIATAFAGTRQQEKFIVLMENYGKALEYANTAATSDGTAEQKYDDAYLQSVEASMNSLKAVWESFSTKILDSDAIKSVLEAISTIAEWLDKIAGILGSNITTAAAFGAAFVVASKSLAAFKDTKLWTELNKWLKKTDTNTKKLSVSFKNLATNSTIWLIAFMSLMGALDGWTESLDDASSGLIKTGVSVIALIGAIYMGVKAWKAYKLASDAANASNPIGWAILAVSALFSLGKALVEVANANSYNTLKAKADELRKEWEDVKNELDDLNKTLEENQERIEELNKIKEDGGLWTATLQNEYDLIKKQNAEYAIQKQLLSDLEAQKQTEAISADIDALEALDTSKEVTGWDYVYWLSGAFWYDALFNGFRDQWGSGDTAKDKYDKAIEALKSPSGLSEEEKRQYNQDISDYISPHLEFVTTYSYDDVLAKDDEEFLKAYNDSWEKVDTHYLKEGKFDFVWDSLTTRGIFDDLFKVEYDENGNKTFVGALRQMADDFTISSDKLVQAANNAEDPLHDFVKYLQGIGMLDITSTDSLSNITNQILNMTDGFRNVNAEEYYNMFSKISSGYDLIKKAQEDLDSTGVISADTINEILGDEDLKQLLIDNNYLVKGAYGYTFADDFDKDDYLNKMGEYYEKQKTDAEEVMRKVATQDENGNWIKKEGISDYVFKTAKDDYDNAVKNNSEWEITVAVTTRTDDIEEFTKTLEEEQENLEERSEQYKDFIDLRKELLETYRDEIDYQKELAQKTKNVADIQTRLALAKLDNSAAGQARQRELQEELNKAQEELNEYTLDKAIDDLLAELDSSADEYEKFIQGQLEIIAGKLDNIVAAYEAANPATVATEEYHTGGFVANQVKIKSNETFAKLLNGELVSTPAQMDNFIKNTLPQLAEAASGGAVIQNNSPLVQINCGNITEEALPDFEKIVDSAVKEVEKNMERALSRAGFKK